MAIRVYKPMTNGTRQRSVLTSEEITKTTLREEKIMFLLELFLLNMILIEVLILL